MINSWRTFYPLEPPQRLFNKLKAVFRILNRVFNKLKEVFNKLTKYYYIYGILVYRLLI